MSFDFGAFGYHATVFVEWTTVAVVAVLALAVVFFAKLMLRSGG